MSNARGGALAATDDLASRLNELARTPLLLVACDFDGTIAPIVSDPGSAEADRESIVALKALAAMPQTHVAIISGRSLSDLAGRTRDVGDAHLVGSHGSEFEIGFTTALTSDDAALRERLKTWLRGKVGAAPGVLIEEKPASLAFHYRQASDADAQRVVDAVLMGPATWPGVFVRHGKKVVELSVVQTNKGLALQRIRQRVGATVVLFLGDDATDEDAFATLGGPDVGVKVGAGDTAAQFRVHDTIDVAKLLAKLVEARGAWLAGSDAAPIEQHALLSDQRTAALVDPRARVVWMCLPRIDSPAAFAALLGGPTAGYFGVSPADGAAPIAQRYLADTFVLETRWPTMRVVDYLDCGGGRAFQRSGRTDLLRVVEGAGRVRVEFAPRLDFGRIETRLTATADGLSAEGAVDSLVLLAPRLEWRIVREGQHDTAVAEVELDSAPLVLEMRYGTGSLEALAIGEPARRERTARHWSGWAAALTLPTLAREHVMRSALVLKALSYGPSGAIAAAATTSLPEHIGGVRNWDYRFCWPRDAAMAATALLRLGAPGPGIKLLDWVLAILDRAEPGALLCPLYTVTGGHIASEGEIGQLAGYRGSRPVRVGNAAAHQVQLDVYGPIAELVARLAEGGAALSAEHWRLVEAMAYAVERRWREPDHGIWEVRSSRRHHVHSKVMCWQTIERALRVARYLGRKRPEWAELRDAIAHDVLAHGWNADVGAFCATYGDAEPDASVLCVGLSGLLPPDDPRFAATVAFIERTLRDGPTVYRYRYDDGLPGGEGGFSLCTAWLIEAYALVGRIADARALFDEFVAQSGPTGLFAEEFDPRTQIALGNFPQAYTHLGLINAALAIETHDPRVHP